MFSFFCAPSCHVVNTFFLTHGVCGTRDLLQIVYLKALCMALQPVLLSRNPTKKKKINHPFIDALLKVTTEHEDFYSPCRGRWCGGIWASQGALLGKEPRASGNSLVYSCLENPMHRGAWRANDSQGHKESVTTEHMRTGCVTANAFLWQFEFFCCHWNINPVARPMLLSLMASLLIVSNKII